MTLRADVAQLQNKIPCQLALNGEVVLVGILRAHVRLKLPKQQVRTEDRPIHGLIGLGILNSREFATLRVKGVGVLEVSLSVERGVEERAKDQGAAPERRLGAELFKHELLDGVVEHTPAGAETGFARFARAPGDADARREGFVVRLGQARRYALVPGNNETDGKYARVVAGWVGNRGNQILKIRNAVLA